MNRILKKICAHLLLLSFASAFFGAATVFATTDEEKSTIKVYSSEPIGAGDLVYHFTACKKERSYGVLQCSKENADQFPKQCKTTSKDKTEEVNEGKLIKGCKIPGQKIGPYDAVNTTQYEKGGSTEGGCADEPKYQGFLYAPEWAVVTEPAGATSGSQWIPHGTIVWQSTDPATAPSDDKFKKIVEEVAKNGVAKPIYRSTLCKTWDEIVGDKEAFGDATFEGMTKQEKEDLLDFLNTNPTAPEEAQRLKDEGCNNDNSDISHPFTDEYNIVHCSIKERITGKTGTELFSKYIGAIYRWAAGIVGIVAVLMMVASGIQISTAGENSEAVTKAKERIMQAIVGLVILFLSGLILYTINPNFFTG